MTIDKKAFRSMSYGLYLISTVYNNKSVGCVVNTFAQVTSNPAQVSIAINKENLTTEGIRQTGEFEAVVLDETASMDLIGTFGFHSSADKDKFAPFPTAFSKAALQYVTEGACSHFSVKVLSELDLGTHILFVGEVTASDVLSSEPPMTYAYYHQVKGGTTPPKASSYNAEEPEVPSSKAASKYAWRCTVCGHMEYVDELPDDFVCPVCGVGKDKFERIEL